MLTGAFLNVVILTSLAHAQANFCDDIWKRSCKGIERLKDGQPGPGGMQKQQELALVALEKAQLQAEAVLGDPKNEQFLDIAKERYGDQIKECKSADGEALCLKAIAKTLASWILNRWVEEKKLFLNNEFSPKLDLDSTEYLIQSPIFVRLEKSIVEMRTDLAGGGAARNRYLQSTFPEVRRRIVERVADMDLPDETRTKMLRRLKAIEPDLSSCNEKHKGLQAMFQADAHYHPVRQTLVLCPHFFHHADDPIVHIFVTAHELSHSIDPCTLRRGPKAITPKVEPARDQNEMDNQHPFANVLKCLRSEQSIKAEPGAPPETVIDDIFPFPGRRPDDFPLPRWPSDYQYDARRRSPLGLPPGGAIDPRSHFWWWFFESEEEKARRVAKEYQKQMDEQWREWEEMRRQMVQRTKTPERLENCQPRDQIGEAFSDWIATETLNQMAKEGAIDSNSLKVGLTKIAQHFCAYAPGGPSRLGHPASQKRMERILMAHPQLRQALGCPETALGIAYCDAKKFFAPEAAKKVEPEKPSAGER